MREMTTTVEAEIAKGDPKTKAVETRVTGVGTMTARDIKRTTPEATGAAARTARVSRSLPGSRPAMEGVSAIFDTFNIF